MSLGGMGEAVAFEGATDTKAFEAYIEHFLAPALSEGQVWSWTTSAHTRASG